MYREQSLSVNYLNALAQSIVNLFIVSVYCILADKVGRRIPVLGSFLLQFLTLLVMGGLYYVDGEKTSGTVLVRSDPQPPPHALPFFQTATEASELTLPFNSSGSGILLVEWWLNSYAKYLLANGRGDSLRPIATYLGISLKR